MIFRQLFDPLSSTYTYLLACTETREGLIIDPVFEQHERDSALIRELNIEIKYVLDTHVHADHVTAAWLMKSTLGAEIVLSRRYGAEGVDVEVDHGDNIHFGDCHVDVLATPGHTNGCLTYLTNDKDMAFTGDCLMIRGAGRTDFQSGDVHALWHSIREQIFVLPDGCAIYPGHDYKGRIVSSVKEERIFNPRIGGDAQEEDFVGYMNNLGLPHPAKLDIAVPANLRCGKPTNEAIPEKSAWGPVTITFAGVPEIQPDWVASHLSELFILDVRAPEEFNGELGHLENACLIPLDNLRERLGEIPGDKPVITVCQSGKRSAIAAEILLNAGYHRVANVSGGLIHWNREALPVIRCEGDQSEITPS